MTNLLRRERITLTTAGGTSTAYGNAYASNPVIGEIVRLDVSGNGLGGSGWWTLSESGGILASNVTGSALDGGEINWNGGCYPAFKASAGSNVMFELMEGSAYVFYNTMSVPYLVVSGCNAGSLIMDIYYKDLRG